jgi:hypothetical protein
MSKKGPHSIDDHEDAMGRCMHRWKHKNPRALHSGTGKKGKVRGEVSAHDQAVAVCLSIQEKGGDGYSEQSLSEVNNLLQDYSQPLVPRISGKGCPRGTVPKGKWCLVRYPDREFYVLAPEGYNCPPGTKGSGGGYCVGNYTEDAPYEYLECPPEQPKKERTPAQQQADQNRSQRQQGTTPKIPRKKREQGLKKAQQTRAQCP